MAISSEETAKVFSAAFCSCVNDISLFKLIDRCMRLEKRETVFAVDILVLDLYNTARPIHLKVFGETFCTERIWYQ